MGLYVGSYRVLQFNRILKCIGSLLYFTLLTLFVDVGQKWQLLRTLIKPMTLCIYNIQIKAIKLINKYTKL